MNISLCSYYTSFSLEFLKSAWYYQGFNFTQIRLTEMKGSISMNISES